MHIDADPPEIIVHVVMTVDEAMEFLSRVEFTEFNRQVRERVQAALTGMVG